MANIKNELNNIKSALYGKDVRSSIHDGIDAINNEVESTTGRQVDLENTFDQLIINAGNSNAEIVDARVKNDGTSYSKLGDRLDAVDSQLEHIAKVTGDLQNDINKYQTIYINSDIYINKQILIPSNKEIVFRNNSKVIANIDGQSNVFKIEGSNVKIFNANIEYSVNGSSPHGGYGNAIVIGDYCYKEEQIYKNILIENCNIVKNNNSHSCIGIFNSCNNIDITNTSIKNSSLGILIHWGGDFNESEPHTSECLITYHPHNIKITNYRYDGVGKGIHLASCYNVIVDGVECYNASNVIEIGVGDYANTISKGVQKQLVCKQLNVKNIYGYNIKNNAISVSGKGRRGGVEPDNVLPKYELTIENVLIEKGVDSSNAAVCVVCNTLTKGVIIKNVNMVGHMHSSHIFLQDCENIKVLNCMFDENNHGITLHNTKNITIDNNKFNVTGNAINFSELSENIKIEKCIFDGNNYPIFIKNGKDVYIKECIFKNYNLNCIKFDGSNTNINILNNMIDSTTKTGISSNIELGKLECANVAGNIFNKGNTKFNINILVDAYKCNIHNNISYGSTNTSNPMMIYQGTRTDRSNTIYNNQTLNDFNIGTFNNYYSIDFIEK